jgi:hypothetical protein
MVGSRRVRGLVAEPRKRRSQCEQVRAINVVPRHPLGLSAG